METTDVEPKPPTPEVSASFKIRVGSLYPDQIEVIVIAKKKEKKTDKDPSYLPLRARHGFAPAIQTYRLTSSKNLVAMSLHSQMHARSRN